MMGVVACYPPVMGRVCGVLIAFRLVRVALVLLVPSFFALHHWR